VWHRPRVGETYAATITDAGTIRLENGSEFAMPSAAAMNAADLLSYDGWYAWRLDDPERTRLHDLRVQLSRRVADETPDI
jgi:hypothetical protein